MVAISESMEDYLKAIFEVLVVRSDDGEISLSRTAAAAVRVSIEDENQADTDGDRR